MQCSWKPQHILSTVIIRSVAPRVAGGSSFCWATTNIIPTAHTKGRRINGLLCFQLIDSMVYRRREHCLYIKLRSSCVVGIAVTAAALSYQNPLRDNPVRLHFFFSRLRGGRQPSLLFQSRLR